MMHQKKDKKKTLLLYLFIFIFLSTINTFPQLGKNFKKFNLNYIEINGLNEDLKKIVQRELDFIMNQNIFFLNKKKIKEKMSELDFLENYTLKKIFPSKIQISAKETEYIATTYRENNKYLIGSNSKFINSKNINFKKDLPIIFGKFEVSDFVDLKNKIVSSGQDYNDFISFFYFPNGRWDIKNKDGLIIKLPRENIVNSLIYLNKLSESSDINKYKVIDLRIPNQIILTYDETKL